MFNVYTRANGIQRHLNLVAEYIVTDRPDEWDYNAHGAWPDAAVFPVSQRHDDKVQRRRAFEYADYLNRVAAQVPSLSQVTDQLRDLLYKAEAKDSDDGVPE